MTKQARIEELEQIIKRLEESNDKLLKENSQLKERLDDKLWPGESEVEKFEQIVLKATKVLVDKMRSVT